MDITNPDDGLSTYRCHACGQDTNEPSQRDGMTHCPECAELYGTGLTHYIPAFTVHTTDGKQTAVCGLAVTAAAHDAEPTCDRCQAWFAALETMEVL